jgi:hypothetical protein
MADFRAAMREGMAKAEAIEREKAILAGVMEELRNLILSRWGAYGFKQGTKGVVNVGQSVSPGFVASNPHLAKMAAKFKAAKDSEPADLCFVAKEYEGSPFTVEIGLAYREGNILVLGPNAHGADTFMEEDFFAKVSIADPEYREKILGEVFKMITEKLEKEANEARLEANKQIAKARQYSQALRTLRNEGEEIRNTDL